MNIVVCIKQVPDVPAIRIDRERMTIAREGVESMINPLDMVALETALRLKKEAGGKVSVVSMGPPQSEEALREALAAGADSALLLTDKAFAGGDTLATSTVLATAIARMNPPADLVLCGMHSIDSDTGHVGPQIAEQLGLPQVCGVNEIRIGDDAIFVERSGDGFLDTIKVRLPALITVAQGASPVVDITLGALEKAFSTGQVETAGRCELGLEAGEVGLKGSATMVASLRTPPPKRTSEKPHCGTPEALCDLLIKTFETLNIIDEADDKEQ
jgi:electron transfer flavoprotein alpha/beta subunit